MPDEKVKKLVLASLFAALAAVMTTVIRVPSPMGGYVNLGDCAVLLAAWVLGPGLGCAAAGLGSMLSDLLGYPLYAPGTLVIKGGMALLAGWLFRRLSKGGHAPAFPALLVSGGLAEALMMAGYFLYEAAPSLWGWGWPPWPTCPSTRCRGCSAWPPPRRCIWLSPAPTSWPAADIRRPRPSLSTLR